MYGDVLFSTCEMPHFLKIALISNNIFATSFPMKTHDAKINNIVKREILLYIFNS